MNLKKAALGAFERALGAKVVRPNRVGRIFETVHLARFFDRFEVDCVFDVGANFGQYAEMIRGLGYCGDIVSFEPIPEAASALRAKAQADPRWHIEEKALDETVHEVAFNIMSSSQFSSLKLPSAADTAHFSDVNVPSRQITVTTATLSDAFDAWQAKLGFRSPFLKMDTQGNDLAVARGAGDRLSRFVGLQSELAIKKIYERQPDFIESLQFYKAPASPSAPSCRTMTGISRCWSKWTASCSATT